jgi:DNA-binding MarR family transcriptional regulator
MSARHGEAANPPDPRLAEIRREILIALRRIIRAIDLYSSRLNEEYGLTGPQLAALHELRRAGSIPAHELARALQVSQPTVTGILDRLERRGLVARTRSGTDRRLVNITVTQAGRQVLEAAPPLLQERFGEQLARLEPWERTLILAILQRVASMMDAGDLAAAPHLVTGPERL